ncbi:hypothetical protein K439DRAFT_443275 [Ramaria rubella]|nr:hypothetical protein K439DRAFT_443275 [Ramaria rubella]
MPSVGFQQPENLLSCESLFEQQNLPEVDSHRCKAWLGVATPFIAWLSLAIANVFVVKRVYILWGYSKRALVVLITTFSLVYITAFGATVKMVIILKQSIFYSPFEHSCILRFDVGADKNLKILVLPFVIPLFFDVFLFCAICWNALDRPRHPDTVLVFQLQRDGAIFFATVLSLRLFNVVVVAVANIYYLQLGSYFFWTMVTMLINRMLITISRRVGNTQMLDITPPRIIYSGGHVATPSLLTQLPLLHGNEDMFYSLDSLAITIERASC